MRIWGSSHTFLFIPNLAGATLTMPTSEFDVYFLSDAILWNGPAGTVLMFVECAWGEYFRDVDMVPPLFESLIIADARLPPQ